MFKLLYSRLLIRNQIIISSKKNNIKVFQFRLVLLKYPVQYKNLNFYKTYCQNCLKIRKLNWFRFWLLLSNNWTWRIVTYSAVRSVDMADSWGWVEVGSIPIFLGNLPPDHTQGQAAEEHEKADRQKTWSHDFGLPAPVLIKNETKAISNNCNNFALLQLMLTLNCTTSIRYYHTLVVFVVCIVKVLTSKKTKYKTSLFSPFYSVWLTNLYFFLFIIQEIINSDFIFYYHSFFFMLLVY